MDVPETEEEGSLYSLYDDLPVYDVYTLGPDDPGEFTVQVTVGNVPMTFTVDTAASVSIISEATYQQNFSKFALDPPTCRLRSYEGSLISIVGEITVPVKYDFENQSATLKLTVARGRKVPLLGRSWLKYLKLDWPNIFNAVLGPVYSVQSVAESSSSTVSKLLHKYSSVFEPVAAHHVIKGFKADIKLREGEAPVFVKARPVPYAMKPVVEGQLDKEVAAGIWTRIKNSKSASPIVVAPKNDRTVRICGDYKVTINKKIQGETHPLPNPEDIFATLTGGKVFSKIDLSKAYQQLELTDGAKELLTINTHKGLFQPERLPAGVMSAPAIFQSVMDQVLVGLEGVCCYLDDILISSPDMNSHMQLLEEVLNRLQKYGILAHKGKCEFACSEIEYLGHKIDGTGLQCTKGKVSAIVNMAPPTNVSELRSFLGLVTYYHKFLPNLATTFAPLYELLKTDKEWKWTEACQVAMDNVKTQLSTYPVLAHYDPKQELRLATDACQYGIGAVISHVDKDGVERPIAYTSRSLSSSEKNYSQIEKEALGIVFGVTKFHKYLYGRKFTLITDHKPLTTIFSPRKAVPPLAALRMQRWALILMTYNYDIVYRRSSEHGNADVLSRFPEKTDGPLLATELSINYFSLVNELPVNSKDIATETVRDPVLSKVLQFTMNGWPEYLKDPQLQPFLARKDELTVDQGCVLWGLRVVIPPKFQHRLLSELHVSHPGIVRMKALCRSYIWYPNMDKDIERMVNQCDACLSTRANPVPATIVPWPTPSHVWERIHLDFGYFKGQDFLILIDTYSKWIEVELMTKTTASKTVSVLRKWFAAYGIPCDVVTDNGPQFVSSEMEEFLTRNGVTHKFSPPYHPNSNGPAEKTVQIVKNALKRYSHRSYNPMSLQQQLDEFLLTYRTTPHSVTKCAPADVFFKRTLRTRFTLLRPDYRQKLKQAHVPGKPGNFPNVRTFSVNDPVKVRQYLHGQAKWTNGVVMGKLSSQRYLVMIGGRERHVHVDQIIHASILQPEEPKPQESFSENTPLLSDQPPPVLAPQPPLQENVQRPQMAPAKPMPVTPRKSSTPGTVSLRPTRTKQPPVWTKDYQMKLKLK